MLADLEERRLDAIVLQRLEHHRRVFGPRPVVEGQHDFLVAQEVVLLECSVRAGPPVVSICTTRDRPIAFGLPPAGRRSLTGRAPGPVSRRQRARTASGRYLCATTVGADGRGGAISDTTGGRGADDGATGFTGGLPLAGEMMSVASTRSEVGPASSAPRRCRRPRTQGHQRCDDYDDCAHRYLRHKFLRLGELSASESAIRRQVNGNDCSVAQSRGIWVPTVKYLPEMCRKFVVLAAELVPPGWHGAGQR